MTSSMLLIVATASILASAVLGANIRNNIQVTSEYYTAFLNISYLDKERGVIHTERTETGRFSSSGSFKEVAGLAVELVANVTVDDDGEDQGGDPSGVSNGGPKYELDYTACKAGSFLPTWPRDRKWIAVIRRGKCTFNTKISNALALNASGVLVYDNDSGGGVLQSMKVYPFTIPSVFTYNWKGLELVELIKKHKEVTLVLEKGSHCRAESRPMVNTSDGEQTQTAEVLYCSPPDAWEQIQHLLKNQQQPFWNWNITNLNAPHFNEKRTSVLFVSVSFIVLMLISLAWLVFYYVQRFRYIHAKDQLERKLCSQAKRALAIISTSVLKKDEIDVTDTCAVCIENYRVADVVRILPCKHQFHKSCIDQWLLEKRTCPMCKMDILKHYGLIDDDLAEDREESMLNLA